MSNTIDFEQQDKEYIANTYGRFNVCFEKGKGSLLWDVNGKEYIDLGSGIGVTAFGVDDMTTFAVFVMAIFTSCFDGTFIRLCTRVGEKYLLHTCFSAQLFCQLNLWQRIV